MGDFQDLKSNIIISVQTKDKDSFKSQIQDSIQHLHLLVDPKGYNIVHDICSSTLSEKDLLPFISFLLETVKSTYPSHTMDALSQLLDLRTVNEGLTPLLISIKYNKPKIFKILLEFGARLDIKDNNSRGPLHVAAACGRIGIFVHLLEKGMDINGKDAQGRAPVHIAALEGQEQMCLAIIAWTTNLSESDNEGFTPLHLAALSQSYKIIRHLLINNADPSIIDKQNRTALDIAVAKGHGEIIKLLKKPDLCFLINPCKVQLKPLKSSIKHPIIFTIYTILRAVLVIILIWPRIDLYMIIGSIIGEALNIILFIYISLKNPGFIESSIPVTELYDSYKPEFICPYCKVFKDNYSKHCQHCQRCIKDFDHHCPWIHNCVGANNHSAFILFLTVSWMDFVYHFLLGLFDYLNILGSPKYVLFKFQLVQDDSSLILCVLCFLGLLLVFPLWIIQIRNWCYNRSLNNKLKPRGSKEFDVIDSRVLLASESEGWISKQVSEALADQDAESGCYFKRRMIRKVNIDINNTTIPS